MEINFKDFIRRGIISDEPLDEVVAKMNTWLRDQEVDVINVETLMRGGTGSLTQHGFRVWYRTKAKHD